MNPADSLRAQLNRPEPDIDLMYSALLLAAMAHPGLKVTHYLKLIETWGATLKARASSRTPPAARLAALNAFMFGELGFRGNREDYYDPRNSYLNEVLERRLGIPITLAVVYMSLGQHLSLDIRGVAFPGHFLTLLDVEDETLVLDPFNEGATLSQADLASRLKDLSEASAASVSRYLKAASNTQILLRMLANLKAIYYQRNEATKTLEVINQLLLIDPELTDEYRDRGLVLYALDCHRAAISDLVQYLARRPKAEDAPAVEQLLVSLKEDDNQALN